MNITPNRPGEWEQGDVTVSLSRKNLEALLFMLDNNAGLNTIHRLCDGVLLTVVAEENDEHYKGRQEEEAAYAK